MNPLCEFGVSGDQYLMHFAYSFAPGQRRTGLDNVRATGRV
jgi:hypothetical protein